MKNKLIKLVDIIPFGLRSQIKRIPIVKQLQSWMLSNWLNEESFTAMVTGGPAKGLMFPVQMPQDKLMWIGTWELAFAQTLYNEIQPGWICYDIGGYKGYYSGIMALRGASEVFVFEPMPGNIENIKKLIKLNPTLPIVLKELAIAETTGKVQFKIMPEETMGKLETSSFESELDEVRQLSVDSISLDQLLTEGISKPDFIKIDVEGAEELVLKGAANLLKNKQPVLMIEIHSRAIGKRCHQILEKYYSSIRVFETNLPPSETDPEICHYIVRK